MLQVWNSRAPLSPFWGMHAFFNHFYWAEYGLYVDLRVCSHIVHQIQTQRGAKLSNIISEGSSLIKCPTCSLCMSFINYRSHDQINILQYTWLYIEIFEAKFLFGQRLWGIDSWFPSRGVESWAVINPRFMAHKVDGSYMVTFFYKPNAHRIWIKGLVQYD